MEDRFQIDLGSILAAQGAPKSRRGGGPDMFSEGNCSSALFMTEEKSFQELRFSGFEILDLGPIWAAKIDPKSIWRRVPMASR